MRKHRTKGSAGKASSWIEKTEGDIPWVGSPGLSTSGVDYDATPIVASANFTGQHTTDRTFDLTPALIERWIPQGASSAGLLIVADDETTVQISPSQPRYRSRENDPAPMLTVDYTPVPRGTVLILR